jgi:hypothetical protein
MLIRPMNIEYVRWPMLAYVRRYHVTNKHSMSRLRPMAAGHVRTPMN